MLINLSSGFFFAKMNKMTTVILSEWAVFFTLKHFLEHSFWILTQFFYHPSETPNFSEDSSWDSLSILLLLLQLLSIRPEATETPPSSNSCPAVSIAIACFMNFSVHQRRARGSLEHSGMQRKGRRRSSFDGVKKPCAPTPSLSLISFWKQLWSESLTEKVQHWESGLHGCRGKNSSWKSLEHSIVLPELDYPTECKYTLKLHLKRRNLLANVKHSYNDPYIKSRDHREKSIIVAAKNCSNSWEFYFYYSCCY